MSDNSERLNLLRKPFLLPEDVLIFPVRSLAEPVRARLDCSPEDYAVTRPGFRSFSRVVDPETAALLKLFRQPMPLVEGILRFCRERALEPQATLADVFPLLQSFSAVSFLVPADSPLAEGVRASFAVGQEVAGCEIRRLIQVLEDTELYQARDRQGGSVALKIARPAADPLAQLALVREATILQHLDGVCSPRLVSSGTHEELPYLVSTWVSGVSVAQRAQELRAAARGDWRQALHALCCTVAAAYTTLHAHDVIHGDVHPGNIVVDAAGRVTLLDFGLSRLLRGPRVLDHNRRAGLAWFMEPELAGPLLTGEAALPAAGAGGEQYALAALIYYLICGEYYLEGAPDREALYAAAIQADPLPFTRRGFESWPQVEGVLRRAMAKMPAARFPSTAAFCSALRRARPPQPTPDAHRPPSTSALQGQVAEILERTALRPDAYATLFPTPPVASLQYGAAGLAWFLYRAAQIREDGHLLAAADLWSKRALSRLHEPDAFAAPARGITSARVGPQSFYHRAPGVHAVAALVAASRGDTRMTLEQAQAFMEAAGQTGTDPELAFGASGTVVGAALLLDTLQRASLVDTQPLRTFLHSRASTLGEDISTLPAIGAGAHLPHLGLAHGWAGVLYAQLLAHMVLGTNTPQTLLERLDQLAYLAEPEGRGVCWPGTLQHPNQSSATPGHAPGWCSGSAGHVYLWTLAHEVTGTPAHLALARRAAWHVWEHPDRHPRLCCGLSGRALALLRLYRCTGEQAWLDRARRLAEDAFAASATGFGWDGSTLSLFWGALGPALLSFELERPETAVMPGLELAS